MNNALPPALDILHRVEASRIAGVQKNCMVLEIAHGSPLERLLVAMEQRLDHNKLAPLVEETARILKSHCILRDIADWPFENFWNNPHEPRHSKLLGYFMDPHQEHGCGSFLLRGFVMALLSALDQPQAPVINRVFAGPSGRDDGFWNDCSVRSETRFSCDQRSGQIDLWVTRDCDSGKFAIIVENKINRAPNQLRQLQKYVEEAERNGFCSKEIFVFFLPLVDDCDPDPTDLSAIRNKGVNYKKVTFDNHIRAWLDAVLASQWPNNLSSRVREHLSYYRNLIDYLVNDRKRQLMDAKILEQLELAEGNNKLPTWSDIEHLRSSAEELQKCMQHVIRGRLLLAVHRILVSQEVDAWLCTEEESEIKLPQLSHYDLRFQSSLDICIRATDAVNVCFGGHSASFWLGYMRSGKEEVPDALEEAIREECEEHLSRIDGDDRPWFAWAYTEVTYGDRCVDTYAPLLAQKLVAMRTSLLKRLRKRG